VKYFSKVFVLGVEVVSILVRNILDPYRTQFSSFFCDLVLHFPNHRKVLVLRLEMFVLEVERVVSF
jgi:hypothetical protein